MEAPNSMGDEEGPLILPAAANLPHDSIANLAIWVAVVCIILSSLAVTLRLYTRHYLMGGVMGIDDTFAVVSLVFIYANCAIIIGHTYFGMGTHAYDLPGPDTIVSFFKIMYAQHILYHANLLFIKLTLLYQYYRLVHLINTYKIPYMVIMATSVLWAFISICLLAFSCSPIAAYWDKTIVDFKCNFITGLVASIGNIITDFVILILPIPVVLHLNMGLYQKLATLAIVTIGSFACVVSILRLVLLPSATDVTYTSAITASWTMAELTSGLLCACLMTLRPLLRRLSPMLGLSRGQWSSSRRTSKSQQTGMYGRRQGYELRSGDEALTSPLPPADADAGSEEELTLHDMFGTSKASTNSRQGNKSPWPDAAPTAPTSPPAAHGSASSSSLHHRKSHSFHVDKICLTPGVETEITVGSPRASHALIGDAANEDLRPGLERKPSGGIHVEQAWSVQMKNADRRAGGEGP